MANENTRIWAQGFDTPEDKLKTFRRAGGFSGKSIDPVYRLQRLTEIFGPCGQGWGFEQTERWREEFATKDGPVSVVFVRGKLWYVEGGERCETCEHTGGTVADRTPDEAYKMAETDALGKCALDLGLAADVYLGLHDGDKYQRPAPARQQGPPPAKAPPAQQKSPRDLAILTASQRMAETPDYHAWSLKWPDIVDHFDRQGWTMPRELTQESNARMAELIEAAIPTLADADDIAILRAVVDGWPMSQGQKDKLYKLLLEKKETL